ncbi:MAG TPA: hypothetical protein VEQ60_18735 [Longimicrobium sp.]|nr:hypothetical protein [Longimicrobium sp.]
MKRLLAATTLILAVMPSGQVFAQQPAPSCTLPAPDALRGYGPQDPRTNASAASAVVASELDFDFSLNPYSLVDATIRFSDDGQKQKLSLTPLRLRARPSHWDAWTLGATNSGGGTTFSTGIGYDWSASYSPRARQLIKGFNCAALPPSPTPEGDETPAEYAKRLEKWMLEEFRKYWEGRVRNTFAITATGSLQTFSSLSATDVDLDDDGVIDNKHQLRSRGVSGQILFRPSVLTTVAVTGQVGERRVSAIETSELRPYRGASLTVTRRLRVLNPAYLSTPEYRSRQYIPSITAGLSLEWLECRGEPEECDNNVVDQRVLTPFTDVRLPGGAQFRVGLPIRRDRSGDKSGTRVVPIAQIGWSMATL